MADFLFGFPCVRQRQARIYRFNDSILIYSIQKLRTRYRLGRASIEYNTNLIEADLKRKTNCYYVLKTIDQVLIALQFYASGGLLQVSLAVHSGRHIGNNDSAHLREIALWDTNCLLAKHYVVFTQHTNR